MCARNFCQKPCLITDIITRNNHLHILKKKDEIITDNVNFF